MANNRVITESHKKLIGRLTSNEIVLDRWSAGIDHREETYDLYRMIEDIDWIVFDDYFRLKSGGDGDNGEVLMYILDIIFDLQDNTPEAQDDR